MIADAVDFLSYKLDAEEDGLAVEAVIQKEEILEKAIKIGIHPSVASDESESSGDEEVLEKQKSDSFDDEFPAKPPPPTPGAPSLPSSKPLVHQASGAYDTGSEEEYDDFTEGPQTIPSARVSLEADSLDFNTVLMMGDKIGALLERGTRSMFFKKQSIRNN